MLYSHVICVMLLFFEIQGTWYINDIASQKWHVHGSLRRYGNLLYTVTQLVVI